MVSSTDSSSSILRITASDCPDPSKSTMLMSVVEAAEDSFSKSTMFNVEVGLLLLASDILKFIGAFVGLFLANSSSTGVGNVDVNRRLLPFVKTFNGIVDCVFVEKTEFANSICRKVIVDVSTSSFPVVAVDEMEIFWRKV